MKRFQQARSFIVPAALLCYLSLALLAYLNYPGPFSPGANWLSDLGDANQNPQGALFYNLGILLTGLLILAFFLGLSQWKMENRKVQNRMVQVTQAFGVLGSIALVMSAVYPISVLEQHRFWSISLYFLLGTAFAFSISALRYQPGCPKWVLVLGGAVALADILSGILHEITLLEWITVALFLTYILVLSLNPWQALEKPA